MNQSILNSDYKKEIDGLRALAVIGVVINHINYKILQSGYLGVDIFFVISGFVITSSLSRNTKSKNFLDFLMQFYSKRIKRILPALTIYVILVSILIYLIVPKNEVLLRTGISSLFGLSNFYLLRQSTDYFAQTTILNPFTHTWSLGVEEQFYFIFPILFWFTGYPKKTYFSLKNLFFTILFLTTISLGSFIYFYNLNISATYFLMPTRFWEISAGCLAFLGYKKFKKNIFVKNLSSEIIFISIIAIMAIPKQFGLIGTISIVFLVILLLFNIKKNSLTYKILSSKTAVYIGSISYSLYLWHWGVLSLSKWFGVNNSILNNILLLILIIFLSIISNLLIENKFRYYKQNNIKTIILGISSLLFSSILIFFPFQKIFKFIGEKPNDNRTTSNLFDNNTENKKCKKFQYVDNEWTKCEVIHVDKKSIILMTGDSMSQSLIPLATKFHKNDNFDFISFFQSSTLSPPIPFKFRQQNISVASKKIKAQKSYLQNIIEYVEKEKYKEKFIWIFNDMNLYFYGREWQKDGLYFIGENKKRISHYKAFEDWLYSLKKLINEANENDIKVLFFGSLPSIQNGYEVICEKNSESKSTEIHKLCKDNVLRRRSSLRGKYKGENFANKILNLEKNNKNFLYFDTAKTLCNDLSNCAIYEKGEMYFSDSVHLSPNKAIELYHLVKSKMKSFE